MTPKMVVGMVGAMAILAGAFSGSEKFANRQTRTDRTTVLYWEKWDNTEGREMQKVVDAFNRSQNRIFVKYLTISGVDTKTLLAASGGSPPDVAGIWSDQVCQFADAGALTDLTQMAADAGLTKDYYIPGYWNELFYRDKLWALPSTPASIALHVRTDLVPKEYATPETFPKTIEEFDKMAFGMSKLKPNGDLEMAGFLPSDPGWWNWIWGLFFGGKLVDGDKITVNSKENLRGFTWMSQYAKKFGVKQVQTFQGGFGAFSTPQDPFMSGKVATEMNGTWKALYIHDYKSNIPWFAVPFPYPKDRPDLAGHTDLPMDILTIPTGAKHPKEAFEFIRYVQRQDVMEGLCIAHGKNSPLAKVSESFFQRHPNPYIRLFDQLARSPKAFSPPMIGIWPQISKELQVAFEEVNGGTKSPEQALNDAQARLEVTWATYKKQVLNQ